MNITGYVTLIPVAEKVNYLCNFKCCKIVVPIGNSGKIVFIHLTISLKALTFSAHGEGGNSEGIDGRGKLAYNEFFLTHVVTTCSIRLHS